MTEPLGADQLDDDDQPGQPQLPRQEPVTPVKEERNAIDNHSPVMDEIRNNGLLTNRTTKMEVIEYDSIKKEAISATDKTKVKSERSKQHNKRKAEQTIGRRKSKRTTKSEKLEMDSNQTKKVQTGGKANVGLAKKQIKRIKNAPTMVASTVAGVSVSSESIEDVGDILPPELPNDVEDGLDLNDVEVVEPTDPEEDSPSENADYGRNEPMQYTCDICDRTLANGYQMQRHLDTHQNERNYRCDQCDRTYKSSSSLAGHLKTCHSGVRPYVCATCGKTFPRQNSLNRHNMIHTGEKPFECEECGKRFPQNAYLKAHMRNHTGEKPYHCRDCGERFKHSGYLMDHRRRIHTGEKRHECGVCGKLFARASDRQRHERTHNEPRANSKRQYKCDACGIRFKFREKLDDHTAEGKCKLTYRMDRAKPIPIKPKVRARAAPQQKPGRKQLKPRRAKLKDAEADGVQSDSSHASHHSKPTKSELVQDAEQALPGDSVPIVFFEDDAPPQLKPRVDATLAEASQYRCETCDEKFEKSSDLVEHNKTHKKQFRCVTCSLSFAWSLDLVKHTKTHSDRGEKYEYQIYNKRYQSDKLEAQEHPC